MSRYRDWNICEHCNLYLASDVTMCPSCDQPLLHDATGKIALWRLGTLPDGIIGHLAAGLRAAFEVGVVVHPTFLDERPATRPKWKGLSSGVFLDQVHRRHREGVFVNLGVTAANIVPDAKHNFLFGYAYMGEPAAVVSLYPLDPAKASPELLVKRLLNIAIHEIGHTLGLDHHGYDDGVECVMIGDEAIDSLQAVDECSAAFCPACREAVGQKRLPGSAYYP